MHVAVTFQRQVEPPPAAWIAAVHRAEAAKAEDDVLRAGPAWQRAALAERHLAHALAADAWDEAARGGDVRLAEMASELAADGQGLDAVLVAAKHAHEAHKAEQLGLFGGSTRIPETPKGTGGRTAGDPSHRGQLRPEKKVTTDGTERTYWVKFGGAGQGQQALPRADEAAPPAAPPPREPRPPLPPPYVPSAQEEAHHTAENERHIEAVGDAKHDGNDEGVRRHSTAALAHMHASLLHSKGHADAGRASEAAAQASAAADNYRQPDVPDDSASAHNRRALRALDQLERLHDGPHGKWMSPHDLKDARNATGAGAAYYDTRAAKDVADRIERHVRIARQTAGDGPAPREEGGR